MRNWASEPPRFLPVVVRSIRTEEVVCSYFGHLSFCFLLVAVTVMQSEHNLLRLLRSLIDVFLVAMHHASRITKLPSALYVASEGVGTHWNSRVPKYAEFSPFAQSNQARALSLTRKIQD